ncbi:MAG TPA: metallophosphoesterase [Candidatus Krumholzibacteria bacterium]|nr:metallophosphoesterase [Candidatus Krumholzibacteria bacterium]HPD71046.1 metallophosphoesterase [Candidatus Krumholzibacteria bacterium]HRY39254.1 metallophosphoesterase [Candidatus Krumholzibacteria bacterium]
MPTTYHKPAGPKDTWFFTSDLHGRTGRYRALLAAVAEESPRAVLLGGDLLPHPFAEAADAARYPDFLADFLEPALAELRDRLKDAFPRFVAIAGNDDPRASEPRWQQIAARGLWEYLAGGWTEIDGVPVLGYPYVPPTPFRLKDWERYDVSRFVDPGCVAPEDGVHSTPIDRQRLQHETIAADLRRLADGRDLAGAILLCHSPPYQTVLDRAALDGRLVDHVPLDLHVGSIALRRFIERVQPAAGLHGHVHESARLCGAWREQLGRTWCMTGSCDGPDLTLIALDPRSPEKATRRLLPVRSA